MLEWLKGRKGGSTQKDLFSGLTVQAPQCMVLNWPGKGPTLKGCRGKDPLQLEGDEAPPRRSDGGGGVPDIPGHHRPRVSSRSPANCCKPAFRLCDTGWNNFTLVEEPFLPTVKELDDMDAPETAARLRLGSGGCKGSGSA